MHQSIAKFRPVPVLAVSDTFAEVKIYTCSEESVWLSCLSKESKAEMSCRVQILPVASLPGHGDWVKYITFQPPP